MNTLVSLVEYTDNPLNNPQGVRFRNLSDRRRFVKDLGLKLVKHPKTGVDCIPVLDKTLMLVGHRKDSIRERAEQFDDKATAKESFKKMQADLKVQTNTSDGALDVFEFIVNSYIS